LKIDLILPNQRRHKRFRYSFPFMYLGLPYVAALTPPQHQVRIIDDRFQKINFDTDGDLIGISILTPMAPRGYEIADEFRRRGKTVVMGGIHASALPDEALQHCDAVVIGEADGTWERLLRDFERGRLERVYRNEKWPSLEGLPLPRRDLMPATTCRSRRSKRRAAARTTATSAVCRNISARAIAHAPSRKSRRSFGRCFRPSRARRDGFGAPWS